MKISTKGRYALRMMLDMAQNQNRTGNTGPTQLYSLRHRGHAKEGAFRLQHPCQLPMIGAVFRSIPHPANHILFPHLHHTSVSPFNPP